MSHTNVVNYILKNEESDVGNAAIIMVTDINLWPFVWFSSSSLTLEACILYVMILA